MVFVVERYLPGLSRSDLLRGLSRLEQAVAAEHGDVRYLGSTIVLEDEACFCQFEGPSEAAVAEANRLAGLAFDRIVPAVTVTPSERRSPMQISTPMPTRVQLGRTRLFGLIAAVAAVVAIASWAIVAYAVGSGSSTGMTQAERQHVASITSLTPAQLRAAFGTSSPEAEYVQGMTSVAKFMWPIPDRGLSRRLYRISARTLVLFGEEDALTPARYADDYVAGIADARKVIVPGAGHMVPIERPEETLAAIEEFLAEG